MLSKENPDPNSDKDKFICFQIVRQNPDPFLLINSKNLYLVICPFTEKLDAKLHDTHEQVCNPYSYVKL